MTHLCGSSDRDGMEVTLTPHSNQTGKAGAGLALQTVFVLLFTHSLLEATDSSFLQRSTGNSNPPSGEPKPSSTEKIALVLMVCFSDKQGSETFVQLPFVFLPLPCGRGPVPIFTPLLPSFNSHSAKPFECSSLLVWSGNADPLWTGAQSSLRQISRLTTSPLVRMTLG